MSESNHSETIVSRRDEVYDLHEKGDADVHPDGGLRAWLVVIGVRPQFGLVNSWGVFQSYYQTTVLQTRSPSDIAWIGSIQYSLMFLPCLVWGRLFDLGYYKSVVLVCYIMLVISAFLVAECREYWHFVLCQGFAIGLCGSGILAPAPAIISQWFKKRRGLAMCIYSTGSSFGGTIIPILTRQLIPRIGFPWTMRILALISIVTLGIAIMLLKRRIPPMQTSTALFNFKAFQSGAYSAYCLSTLFIFLGIYTVLTYIDIGAVSHGISPNFAFYLVAIANAGSGLGRYCAGLCADRMGPMNVMMPMTLACAAVTYAWPFAHTKGTLVAVAVLYGYATGSFLALTPNPVIEFGDPSDIGKNVGMLMSIIALGALAGPPISGVINSATGGFVAVGCFAGSAVLLGVGLMVWSKYLALGSVFGKL
ncbi:major facilitator superfamily domain-containing protein [Mucidula mucida]|nr:major facilitator superfamily domain-containing protein [Mucidula mucida]